MEEVTKESHCHLVGTPGHALLGSYEDVMQRDLDDIRKNPLYVILDLGCTRAMGSRVAIMNFIEAAKNTSIKTEILPTNGTFNFANSQTTTCKEKMSVVSHRTSLSD